jgi:thymidylate synthase ThyX
MFDENLRAELIYDGTDDVYVPSTMEDPGPGQMVGTPHERLGEVSGRLCYESMGLDPTTGKPKGRSSIKFHEHIKEVKNHSVYEHCTFTVTVSNVDVSMLALAVINRPGIWFQPVDTTTTDLTLNHRSVLEWGSWSNPLSDLLTDVLGTMLWNYAYTLAPSLYGELRFLPLYPGFDLREKKENFTPSQAWVSLYLSMSRGASHEQVRHGDFSAISQRSTRYVQESESPYITHPLITYYLEDREVDLFEKRGVIEWTSRSQITDQKCYDLLVTTLQEYLKKRGVEGTSARKQARGAARGYLGNALFTDMIFSANVRQWRWMLTQRASSPADAEIRNLYAPHVLWELLKSQYAHMFHDMELVPAPDGIGQIVVPTK